MGETTASQHYLIEEAVPSIDERPRERLIRYGAQALSSTELLAIALRTGTEDRSAQEMAEHLLQRFHGLRGVAKASLKELARVKGVGPTKAMQIAACVELGRRLAARVSEPKPIIHSPEDVADLLMPELSGEKKEHVKSLLLDTKNRVMSVNSVSVGSLDSSIVHPREVFKDAIAASAASIILAHNHPSGDPTPSQEDQQITLRLVKAGEILGVDVLDHLILGDGKWVSLKQIGMM
jgi:DNA repair protein RadC